MTTEEAIAKLDWAGIGAQLDQEGHAILPGFLSEDQVRHMTNQGSSPDMDADLRVAFYEHLVPMANRWNDVLGVPHRYPPMLDARHKLKAGQARAHSSISRLREGDYQALHQWGEGDHAFPLQLTALLSEPGQDFTGGEFVMTEQRPRMQSRPIVLPLHKGDLAIVTTAKRPHKGTRDYYRVNLKHAVSRVRSGERIGWELLFHDTPEG
jgi:hypothetical protein